MIINQTVAGGLDINGIIQEYKVQAGASVSAGDFVEFVNNYATPQKSGVPSNSTVSTTTAACLSGNKVLIIWQHYNNYYQYGVVATVENGTVTFGSVVKSKTNGYVASVSSAFLIPLTDTTACYIAANSTHDTIAYICTVSGTSVSFGSVNTLNSTCDQAKGLSVTKLSNTKLLIAHRFCDSEVSNIDYLKARVLTISGTTITAGTVTSLATSFTGASTAIALSETSALIAYGSSSYLKGLVVTISGTTITAGTVTTVSDTTYDGYRAIQGCLIGSNQAFIAYSRGSNSSNYLYGKLITVSGTSISVGTELLSANTGVAYQYPVFCFCPTQTGSVVFAYPCVPSAAVYASGNYYYDKYIGFVELSVSSGTVNVLSSNNKWISCGNSTSNSITLQFAVVLLGDGELFEAHGSSTSNTSNESLYYTVNLYDCVKYPCFAKPYESTISGIANTAGAGGQMVEVYVPRVLLTLTVTAFISPAFNKLTVTCPDGTTLSATSDKADEKDTFTFSVNQYGTYTVVIDNGKEGENTGSATFVAGGPTTITVSL